MPVQKSSGSVTTMLKGLITDIKKAHAAHKDDEPEVRGARLPAGIENGQARVQKCLMQVIREGDNKGKIGWYAEAVVLEPEFYEGQKVSGLTTFLFEPLCATPKALGKRKTVGDHYAWILMQWKLLGLNPDDVDPDNLEAACKSIEDAQPVIYFRTWKGKKQTTGIYKDREPRVNHDWLGVVADGATTSNGEQVDAVEAGGDAGDEATSPGDELPDDLDELAALASDEKDPRGEAAGDRLKEMAIGSGMSAKQVKDAESWQEVADKLKEQQGGDEAGGDEQKESPAEESADDDSPQLGGVYGYKVFSPAKNKTVTVEVEATKIDKAKRTVDLLDNINKKTVFKNVPWDKLVEAPA